MENPETLFVSHLPWIERVAHSLTRRHGLDPDEQDDFVSWAKLKIMEDNYAVLRKYRGDSQLTTYLTVVLSILYSDYRVARWGRWRPSAAARKHGPLAVRLEALIYRDGLTSSQAIATLRESDPALPEERELIRLLAELPPAPRGRPTPEPISESVVQMPSEESADTALSHLERTEVRSALEKAMSRLAPEDAVIVRMRFLVGASVADIARVLHLEQKPLYRRLERILLQLRQSLESDGINRSFVSELLEEESIESAFASKTTSGRRQSHPRDDG